MSQVWRIVHDATELEERQRDWLVSLMWNGSKTYDQSVVTHVGLEGSTVWERFTIDSLDFGTVVESDVSIANPGPRN